jgi:hypothetical protein
MHRALNIDKKKLITQFGRDEIQTKMLHEPNTPLFIFRRAQIPYILINPLSR